MKQQLLTAAALYCHILLSLAFQQPPAEVKDASKVDGLAITATLKGQPLKSGDSVPPCRQVIIQAKLSAEKGDVRWLVFGSGTELDFETSGNTVALVSLPDGGRVDVFAIASNDGKLTEFASFVIVSKGGVVPPGPPLPEPMPPVKPPAKPVEGKVHVSIVWDEQANDPATAAIVASPNLKALGPTQYHPMDWRNQALARSRINATASGVILVNPTGQVVAQSALPALLVTDDKGNVHKCQLLPKTETEAFAVLRPYFGGK